VNLAKLDKHLEDFLETVYPGIGALAITSFDESEIMKDAAELIRNLRKEVEFLERENEALKVSLHR
jgi:hypothetical protein